MKRCPQCNFIYLDSDDACDLDQTQLVDMDESEIESHSEYQKVEAAPGEVTQPESSRSRKPFIVVATSGVAIALVLLVIYFASRSRVEKSHAPENANSTAVASVVGPAVKTTPGPSASGSLSPESSPSPSVKPTPLLRNTHSRGTVSSAPVSTGVTDNAARAGSVTIRLTNGSRIEADEAWRTKDGIWYRRNGMVTLLKRSQVRGIERGP